MLDLFSSPIDGSPTWKQALSIRHVSHGALVNVWPANVQDRRAAPNAPDDLEPHTVCILTFIKVDELLKTDRNTLYPGLLDHESIQNPPDVRGMVKNLFFITHNHKENGGTDDTASKYNMYEVRTRSLS